MRQIRIKFDYVDRRSHSFGEAVEMLGKIGAKRSFITHLPHNSEHNELQARLGDAVTVP